MNTLISQTDEQLIIKGLVEDLTPFAEYANHYLEDGYQIVLSGSNTDEPEYVTLTIPVNYPKYYQPVMVYGDTYMLLSKHPRMMIVQHDSPAKWYTLQIEDLIIAYYPMETK